MLSKKTKKKLYFLFKCQQKLSNKQQQIINEKNKQLFLYYLLLRGKYIHTFIQFKLLYSTIKLLRVFLGWRKNLEKKSEKKNRHIYNHHFAVGKTFIDIILYHTHKHVTNVS